MHRTAGESREDRRVQKRRDGIFQVGDAATTKALLLPYRCHDQYKNDALATAPQDFEDRFRSISLYNKLVDMWTPIMCQPYPKAQAHLKTEYSSVSTLLTLSSALNILSVV